MIERLYLRDFLSFQSAQLELKDGLIVFSGPSGSGKSILMQALLSSFGLQSSDAAIAESSVTWQIAEDFGIENEEVNIFKQVKKEKTRYFINAQSVAKKTIATIAQNYLRHLSLKDYSDFENENLLSILDHFIAKKDPSIAQLKADLAVTYHEYKKVQKELQQIEEEERKVDDLKEFTRFEIEKIENINPKIGEYEELFEIKKELSKKEKVQEAIQKAYTIFEAEHYVSEVLDLLEEDSGFFDDAMNTLRSKLENADERFSALEEVDVEEVLDRLEALSDLKRKYGSIEEALEHLELKKQELQKYENIAFEKTKLQEKVATLQTTLENKSATLSTKRAQVLAEFEKMVQNYTDALYLQGVSITLEEKPLNELGKDKVILQLHNVPLEKLSTGEFNRLRLAILVVRFKLEQQKQRQGVLILDEIDANLSGEESMSVASVLKTLSKGYQIIVISHQPQLTSAGDQHFFVYKDKEGHSHVKELSKKERIEEIARIISGENISQEARKFAKELLDSKEIK